MVPGIRELFRKAARVTDIALGACFHEPHLDLCGRRFAPENSTGCFTDPDGNAYISYFRYLRDVNFDLTSEDEEQHLKLFRGKFAVHDNPIFSPKAVYHSMVCMGAKLIDMELFFRAQRDTDPYAEAFQLIGSGFYVAPALEMFDQMAEVVEALTGAEQDSDIDVICEFTASLAKFKIVGDDQEEEDDAPEEVPEDENETEQVAEEE